MGMETIVTAAGRLAPQAKPAQEVGAVPQWQGDERKAGGQRASFERIARTAGDHHPVPQRGSRTEGLPFKMSLTLGCTRKRPPDLDEDRAYLLAPSQTRSA